MGPQKEKRDLNASKVDSWLASVRARACVCVCVCLDLHMVCIYSCINWVSSVYACVKSCNLLQADGNRPEIAEKSHRSYSKALPYGFAEGIF